MPAHTKLAAQLAIVVDLAVEDREHALVFVGNRLPAADDIDDAEPPHAERDLWCEEISILVRTAVTNGVAHQLQSGRRSVRGCRAHPAGDSTHQRAFTRLTSAARRRKTNSLHPTVPPAVVRRDNSNPRWRK